MYKIAVLLFVTTALAKIRNPKHDYIVFEHTNSVAGPRRALRREPIEKGWVLDFTGEVDILKLRAATNNEVREVFSASPLDIGGNHHQGKVMKKDKPSKPAEVRSSAAPEQIDIDEKATIAEMKRMINKFALSTDTDPDAYLAGVTDNSPSIKLYFKGVHTSLVVRAKGKQWHYIIGPPALFPKWFYEKHTNVSRDSRGVFVELPRNIKMQLFSVVLRLFTMFFSFPM